MLCFVWFKVRSPNLPTNIIPTKIAWLKLSGEFPMDMIISPLLITILLESNPLRSTMLCCDQDLAAQMKREAPKRGIPPTKHHYTITKSVNITITLLQIKGGSEKGDSTNKSPLHYYKVSLYYHYTSTDKRVIRKGGSHQHYHHYYMCIARITKSYSSRFYSTWHRKPATRCEGPSTVESWSVQWVVIFVKYWMSRLNYLYI